MTERSTEWQPNERIHLWENFERCPPLGAEMVEVDAVQVKDVIRSNWIYANQANTQIE